MLYCARNKKVVLDAVFKKLKKNLFAREIIGRYFELFQIISKLLAEIPEHFNMTVKFRKVSSNGVIKLSAITETNRWLIGI